MNERRVYFGRHLRLVRPEDQLVGPFTRLGLRNNGRFVSQKQIMIAIATKVVLLAMVLWIIYKN